MAPKEKDDFKFLKRVHGHMEKIQEATASARSLAERLDQEGTKLVLTQKLVQLDTNVTEIGPVLFKALEEAFAEHR